MTELLRINWPLAIETSWQAITAHKFRTALSLLGIVLGASSLMATLALTAGIERGTRHVLQNLGGLERVEVVHREVSAQENPAGSFSPGRTFQDAIALRLNAPLISHVSPEIRKTCSVSTGGKEEAYAVLGVLPDHFVIMRHELAAGRFLTHLDNERGRRAVVIGHAIARRFFKDMPPEAIPGRILLLDGFPYEIAGVLQRYEREEERIRRERGLPPRRFGRWNPFRQKNEAILVPFATAFHDFRSGQFPQHNPDTAPLDQLNFRVADLAWFSEALEQARTVLETTHRGVEDFDFITREEWAESMEASIRATRLSGGLIAGISLLVGGIGIANIMLAGIAERVREIGIRRAIGARARDIFVQVVLEGALLGVCGGLLGLLAGLLLIQGLVLLAPGENMPVLTLPAAVLSAGFAAVTGLAAGLYPAAKAAALNPVAALRYE